MEQEKLVDLKYMFLVQVIRDILIEKELTTREEFKTRVLSRLESSPLSEEDKKEIKNSL
jgi:hypothetical protein